MARRAKNLHPGERVKITGQVALRDDDGEVSSTSVKGVEGSIIPCNAFYKSADTGENMVGIRADNGAVIAVPERAVSRPKKSFFFRR